MTMMYVGIQVRVEQRARGKSLRKVTIDMTVFIVVVVVVVVIVWERLL